MNSDLSDSIEVDSGTQTADEVIASLAAVAPPPVAKETPVGDPPADQVDDEADDDTPAVAAPAKPVDASEAGRVLADARTVKRITALKEHTTLYADNIRKLGGTVPEFKARTYGKPVEEIDHLSRYRHELLEAFNKTLAAPPRPAQPAKPTPPAADATPKPAAPVKKFEFASWEKYQEEHPDADYTDYTDARSDARDAHKDEQRAAERAAKDSETHEAETQRQIATEARATEAHIEAYAAKNPEFFARLATVNIGDVNLPTFPIVNGLLRKSGANTPVILDYLADHQDDVTRLMGSGSLADTLQTFGEIRYAALQAAKQAPAEGDAEPPVSKARPSTNAPAPIARVPGLASPTRTLADIAADDDDADAYIAKKDPGLLTRAAGGKRR